MRKNWPLKVLLALIFTACLSGAYGYLPVPSTASPFSIPDFDPDQSSASQYSDYYTIPASPYQGTHIIEPEEFELEGKTPATIYYGNQRQAVPYSTYQTMSAIAGNTFWIQGTTSWSQYAVVPQGAFLSLIAISPGGGNGDLQEMTPDGRSIKYSYQFYPFNRLGFYADRIGRHVLFFTVNGMVSSPVVIDVIPYTPPVYTQPIYYIPAFYYYHQLFNACPDDRRFCYGNCCPQGYIWKDCRCQPSCPPDKKCGNQCCKQGEVCIDGQCRPSCPPDKKCGSQCCKQGEVCLDSQCRPSCPPDKKCGSQCCQYGEVCIDGQCQSPCPEGQKCGSQCCQYGEFCRDGQCQSPCPEGQQCGDKCCRYGQVCVDGQCQSPCPEGQKCGRQCCNQGEVCRDGQCQPTCLDGRCDEQIQPDGLEEQEWPTRDPFFGPEDPNKARHVGWENQLAPSEASA